MFLLFSNKIGKRKAKINYDERDRLILIRATLAGYAMLWLYFVAACIFAWLSVAPERSISINVMPMVIVGGIAVFHFVQGVTTLIQYSWAGKGEKNE